MSPLRLGLAALILCSMPGFAQSVEVRAKPLTDNDIQLLREDLQSAKDKVIADTMGFSPTEKSAFWSVYQDYSREQRELADKRLRLITEYAQNLDKMNDEKATSIIQRLFQIDDDTQALRKKYFPRFTAALGAKRAAKFYQVDNRLTMMTNVQLASEIPLIP